MEEHPHAKHIVQTLHHAGYIAYYAGGWVRDFLLNHASDDVDIATNAPPEKVQELFTHTVPIGIAFGIILVLIEGHPYEVATFRQDFDYQNGRSPERIAFTDAKEDAKRRDFTINGLFYDPLREEVHDFVNGRADLQAGIIRAIGDPHERIREDRLRMMRAVRLACRFKFQIDPRTESAIRAHAHELQPAVAMERIVQELSKGHAYGALRPFLVYLHDLGLLPSIFPALKQVSLQEIEERLAPLARYPKTVPLIGGLLLLFPELELEARLDLCKTLKLSNIDIQFATFFTRTKELSELELTKTRPVENIEWVYVYANPFATTVLQMVSAHLSLDRSEYYLKMHEERIASLQEALERIQSRNPVVKAKDLQKEGISPGKTMGILLKDAERVACNEKIWEPQPIIEKLKKSSIWPQ